MTNSGARFTPRVREDGVEAMTDSVFAARPQWQRVAWRLWRKVILVGLLRQEKWRYIVPPREIDQETMDAAIKRGQELAKEHGW